MSGQLPWLAASEEVVTRYRMIAEALIEQIREGQWPVGSTLPGEYQLTRDFGVSRHTVRDALRQIEELGLVERRRGVGTRVLSRRPERAYVHRVSAPSELLQYPRASRLEVIDRGLITASPALAAILGCKPRSRWLRVRALRRMSGGRPPICRLDLYLRPKYAEVAGQVGQRRGLVYEALERRFGVHVAEVSVEIMARPMPVEAAAALGVDPGSPSMTVVRRYQDEKGDIMQVSVSEHPGDRYTFGQRLRRGWDRGSGDWSPA